MTIELRAAGNGLHLVGPLTTVNYALNPSFEALDNTLLNSVRTNLCTNPSFETSLSGWTTTGTIPPSISQSMAQSSVGSFSMKGTWNGAGVLPAVWGPDIPTTIGQTYTVSMYVWVPTGNPGLTINITNGGTLGGSSTTNNQWQRISQTFTASATSSHVQIWPSVTPSAGQYFYVDAVLYENASSVADYFDGNVDQTISRTNLCTNPSFETNTTGWGVAGAHAPSLSTTTGHSLFGKQSLLISWSAGGGTAFATYNFTTVIGQYYTASIYIYIPNGSPGVILTTYGSGVASSIQGDWQRLTYTALATSTSSQLQIFSTVAGTGQCFVDGVLIEQSGSANDFFDGSTPPFSSGVTQQWTGTAHASTSTQHVPHALLAWTGTANLSSSTRSNMGPMFWTATNALVLSSAVTRVAGRLSAKIMPTSTSLIPKMSQTFNVIDQTNYSVSFSVFIPATITGGGIAVEYKCFDSSNTLISTTQQNLLLSGNATNGFIRLATTFAPTVSSTTMSVAIRPINQPSSLTDAFYIDHFMFERADTSSLIFLDGSIAGYCWAGTPHQSTTLQTEFADALNFFAGFNYTPPPAVPVGNVAMAAQIQVEPSSWPPIPLTD